MSQDMRNNKIGDYAGDSKHTASPSGAPTHADSLGGVVMDSGPGTRKTSTMAGVRMSTKGIGDAMEPHGPGGSR